MLSELLTSTTRAEIMRILFNGLNEEHYLRGLEKLSNVKVSSLQKEVKHLSSLELLRVRKDGNRTYYSANIEHPLYFDLVSIVKKTVGVLAKLQKRLEDPRVKCAFIFGSFAKGEEGGSSDIDLFVIGDIGMRAVSKLLSSLQGEVGREINTHVLTIKEFKKRTSEKNHFIKSVLKGNIKVIKGSIDEVYRETS